MTYTHTHTLSSLSREYVVVSYTPVPRGILKVYVSYFFFFFLYTRTFRPKDIRERKSGRERKRRWRRLISYSIAISFIYMYSRSASFHYCCRAFLRGARGKKERTEGKKKKGREKKIEIEKEQHYAGCVYTLRHAMICQRPETENTGEPLRIRGVGEVHVSKSITPDAPHRLRSSRRSRIITPFLLRPLTGARGGRHIGLRFFTCLKLFLHTLSAYIIRVTATL